MKTSVKILSSVFIAVGPAAAVAAAAGFSNAAALGPATVSACLALVGLQLVVMSEKRSRPAVRIPEATPAAAYDPRSRATRRRRLHRNLCVTP